MPAPRQILFVTVCKESLKLYLDPRCWSSELYKRRIRPPAGVPHSSGRSAIHFVPALKNAVPQIRDAEVLTVIWTRACAIQVTGHCYLRRRFWCDTRCLKTGSETKLLDRAVFLHWALCAAFLRCEVDVYRELCVCVCHPCIYIYIYINYGNLSSSRDCTKWRSGYPCSELEPGAVRLRVSRPRPRMTAICKLGRSPLRILQRISPLLRWSVALWSPGAHWRHCDGPNRAVGCGIPFVPVLWVLESCVPQNTVRYTKLPIPPPRNKNVPFVWMCTNIVTFSRWEQTSRGTGQPSAGHKQEGIVRDRNMCRLVIVECALGLRGAREWCVKGSL